jgi:hypothetical protein
VYKDSDVVGYDSMQAVVPFQVSRVYNFRRYLLNLSLHTIDQVGYDSTQAVVPFQMSRVYNFRRYLLNLSFHTIDQVHKSKYVT